MDFQRFEGDNAKNCIVESAVPEIAQTEPCCLGIDEAGRGPVLGPMVYGVCYCPLSKQERLKELGFADSKTLSEQQREELFTVIDSNKELLGWAIDILSPTYLSTCMLGRSKYSLNAISHDSAMGLIQLALDRGAQIEEVYVDTVGPAQTYEEKLQKRFPDLKITVAAKADAKFPIVSAASICAKVARDRVLNAWKFSERKEFSRDYGSGYPSDPNTKSWLQQCVDPVFGFPQFVRFSWSTCQLILEQKVAPVSWDDDDEVDESAKGTAPITSFFGKKVEDKTKERHHFFQDRFLEPVTGL